MAGVADKDEREVYGDYGKLKELFFLALEVAPEERERFLSEACAHDESMREEVLSLVRSWNEVVTTPSRLQSPHCPFPV